MGTWGSGPFDNDDAADWRYQLVDGGGIDIVASELRVAGRAGMEAPQAQNAIAAAAIVAAALDGNEADLPNDVIEWLAAHRDDAWPEVAPLAVRVLDSLLADSELNDLWEEEDDDTWAVTLGTLRDRLTDASSRGQA
jgi:hypothetical protein